MKKLLLLATVLVLVFSLVAQAGTRQRPTLSKQNIQVTFPEWGVTLEMEMQEIIRGSRAWDIIYKANHVNDPPAEGKEYILAKFMIRVIDTPDADPISIMHRQFEAVSMTGVVYKRAFAEGLTQPLNVDLYKGAQYTGWTYFEVDKADNPLIVFLRGHKGEQWFSSF